MERQENLSKEELLKQAKQEKEAMLIQVQEETENRRIQQELEKQARENQTQAWEKERLKLSAQLSKEKEVQFVFSWLCTRMINGSSKTILWKEREKEQDERNALQGSIDILVKKNHFVELYFYYWFLVVCVYCQYMFCFL